jgi:hypothetical protein
MSDQNPPESPADDDLQFDQAEYAANVPAAVRCGTCEQEINDEYYEINGHTICDGCRKHISARFQGGSKLGRFFRAALYGSGAGVAGFAIYFGVMKVTGIQMSLISILVGFMVGKAVWKGSQGRGGWVYQLLAVFLTYTAIGASYSAIHIPEFIKNARDANEKPADVPGRKAVRTPDKKAAGAPGVKAAQPAPPQAPVKLSAGKLFLALALLALFLVVATYALPIAAGIESPMVLLIVGFALWEAWKFNVRRPVVFNGPFRVGDPGGFAPDGMLDHA